MFGRRERYLALVVLAVLFAYVGDRLLLTPLLAVWREDGERVAALRAELLAAESLADSLPNWRRERERRRELSFPSRRTEAENEVLKMVAGHAVGRGVLLKGLRPAWRETGGADKNSPLLLELAVSAEGNLAAVAGFLHDLETMPPPVRLERTRLHSRAENGRALDVELVLTALPGTVVAEVAR